MKKVSFIFGKKMRKDVNIGEENARRKNSDSASCPQGKETRVCSRSKNKKESCEKQEESF
jgi:hypothetical protein